MDTPKPEHVSLKEGVIASITNTTARLKRSGFMALMPGERKEGAAFID